MAVEVGDPAPDFSLRDARGEEFRLSSYAGRRPVVLAFYVLAFTGG
jgi:peroxiredoxin